MAVPTTGVPTDSGAALVGPAAAELSAMLPSPVPLRVAEVVATGPAADAVAVRASFVGAVSAELVLVADQAVADALAGAAATGGAPLSLADALRPALEAAASVLGAGVLDAATAGPVGSVFDDDDLAAVGLVDSADIPRAWFGLRVRQSPEAIPHQRAQSVTTGMAGTAGMAGGAALPTQLPADTHTLRLLHDVEMTLTAEIGRTRLPVRQVLELVPGTVLELDRAAGAPADVMVNGRLVARGEVVVVDEEYGIRITEIVGSES
nr:flagellar motor switch protein FliN [uncultured Actinotalea sp.]